MDTVDAVSATREAAPTSPIELVLSHLDEPIATENGWEACCPAHADDRPSLSISEGAEGQALLHCHAGCSLEEILSALGIEKRKLFGKSWTPIGVAIAEYVYRSKDRLELCTVHRTADKGFIASRPDPSSASGRTWNLQGVPRTLYRLPELMAAIGRAETVFVMEGEKDVEAAAGLGVVATTNFGGAGKWRHEHSEELRGADVIVVQDRDAAGREHGAAVVASLRGIARRVRLVEAAEGKDLSDHVAAGFTMADLVPVEPTKSARRQRRSSGKAKPDALDEPDADDEAEVGAIDPLPWVTALELGSSTPPEPDWVIRDFLALGCITQLGARVKVGKTSLVAGMIEAVLTGRPFLGRPTKAGPVVLLTEERRSTIRFALARAHLAARADLHILSRADVRATSWPEAIAGAITKAKDVGAVLIVIDTLTPWARLGSDTENRAGDALDAVEPILEAAQLGFAVLVVQHHRKGGGDVDEAVRGSSAFGGAFDVLFSLNRATKAQPSSRRIIEGVGRLGPLPDRILIELQEEDGRFVQVNEESEAEDLGTQRLLMDLLPGPEADFITRAGLAALANLPEKHTAKAVEALVVAGLAERVGGLGPTKRAFGYRLAAKADAAEEVTF